MYSLKKMTQKISKTYTLSFPKAAHSLEAQDQGVLVEELVNLHLMELLAVAGTCKTFFLSRFSLPDQRINPDKNKLKIIKL